MSKAPWIKIEKPYGFRVTIERSLGRAAIRETFLCKTPHPAQATQQARYKTGFLRLISCAPLTQGQWNEAFASTKREAVRA